MQLEADPEQPGSYYAREDRRGDLSLPLQFGPWWVGMAVLGPMAIAEVIGSAIEAAYEGAVDAVDRVRQAARILWKSR